MKTILRTLGSPSPAVPVEQHEQTKDDDAGELDDQMKLMPLQPMARIVELRQNLRGRRR